MSSPTPPNPQPPVAKKTSIWVWILGGIAIFFFAITLTCGVIGYMGMRMIKNAGFDSELMKTNPGLAMAKMVTAMNPDYETVKTNDRAGTIVVREKSTGKTITMKFDPDAKKMVIVGDDGKQSTVTLDNSGFSAQSPDGSVKFGGSANAAPAWVPVYPGSSPQNTLSATSAEGSQNTFTFKSKDPATKIISYYSDQLKSAGFSINLTSNTDQGGMMLATDEGKKHTITISVGTSAEGTETAVTAIEKNRAATLGSGPEFSPTSSPLPSPHEPRENASCGARTLCVPRRDSSRRLPSGNGDNQRVTPYFHGSGVFAPYLPAYAPASWRTSTLRTTLGRCRQEPQPPRSGHLDPRAATTLISHLPRRPAPLVRRRHHPRLRARKPNPPRDASLPHLPSPRLRILCQALSSHLLVPWLRRAL